MIQDIGGSKDFRGICALRVPFSSFDMYSFVIKIAILLNRAVVDEIKKPAPRLINPFAELPIADPDPVRTSVIIHNFFFLFKFLYFLL